MFDVFKDPTKEKSTQAPQPKFGRNRSFTQQAENTTRKRKVPRKNLYFLFIFPKWKYISW